VASDPVMPPPRPAAPARPAPAPVPMSLVCQRRERPAEGGTTAPRAGRPASCRMSGVGNLELNERFSLSVGRVRRPVLPPSHMSKLVPG